MPSSDEQEFPSNDCSKPIDETELGYRGAHLDSGDIYSGTNDFEAGDTSRSDDAAAIDSRPVGNRSATPRLANYHILRTLGRGGMGTVYLAEQEKPIRRQLALKVMNEGIHSQHAKARFQLEQQTLARLNHPGIAKIVDAGVDENDRPYFAMEFIDGVSLNRFCDEHKLSLNMRLELFGQVCDAVQHAHQKGIIHRDLKPQNILVTDSEGDYRVQVIDFGLSKNILEQPELTLAGQVLGTLQYMSPEQTEATQAVDTRTDVYALGVILFELLTGTTPLAHKMRVQSANIATVLDAIRNQDPPRASECVSSMDQVVTKQLLQNRSITSRELLQRLSDDLDWIMLKAMDKEPEFRYESPAALLRDIKAFVSGLPISARPPSRIYWAKRFFKRNRTAVMVSLAVAISLLIATGVSLTAWRRATTDRMLAESRRNQFDKANRLMRTIFDDIGVGIEQDYSVPLRSVIADRVQVAASELARDDLEDPITAAELLHSMGRALHGLGADQKALSTLRRARSLRGEEQRFSSEFGINLEQDYALAMLNTGQPIEGVEVIEKLFDEVVPLSEQTKLRDPLHLTIARNLADAYVAVGEPQKAVQLLERKFASLADGSANNISIPEASALSSLAVALAELGQLEQSGLLFDSLTDALSETIGSDSGVLLQLQVNRASVQIENGEAQSAIKMLEILLPQAEKTFGPDHVQSHLVRMKLAIAYSDIGQLALATELARRAERGIEAYYGEDHLEALRAKANLTTVLSKAGNTGDAIALREQILKKRLELLPAGHHQVVKSYFELGIARFDAGQFELATNHMREALHCAEQAESPDIGMMLYIRANLGKCLQMGGDAESALRELDEIFASDSLRESLSATMILYAVTVKGSVLQQLKRHEEARIVYQSALDEFAPVLGIENPQLLAVENNLAGLELAAENLELAESMHRITLEKKLRNLDSTHPSVLISKANLAKQLRKRQGLSSALEAEELLRSVVETSREVFPAKHPDRTKYEDFYRSAIESLDSLQYQRNSENLDEKFASVEEWFATLSSPAPADLEQLPAAVRSLLDGGAAIGKWTATERLPATINTDALEETSWLAADGLTLYFSRKVLSQAGIGPADVFSTTRPAIDQPWKPAEPLAGSLNSTSTEWSPAVTPDGRELVFHRSELYSSRHYSGEWTEPEKLTFRQGQLPYVSADGLRLWFSSQPKGKKFSVFRMMDRPTNMAPWSLSKPWLPDLQGKIKNVIWADNEGDWMLLGLSSLGMVLIQTNESEVYRGLQVSQIPEWNPIEGSVNQLHPVTGEFIQCNNDIYISRFVPNPQ